MSFMQILATRKSPEHQLEDLVRANDVTGLDKLLKTGVNPDITIHKHGGDRAVHVAAILGHFRCIETLAAAGADLESSNDVDVTPLFNAARSSHPRAMDVLLRHSPHVSEINTLWTQERWSRMLRGLKKTDVLRTLLRAVPDFNKLNVDGFVHRKYSSECVFETLKLLILSGVNLETPSIRGAIEKIMRPEIQPYARPNGRRARFRSWYQDFTKGPQSLTDLSRLVIRRSFDGQCNVYYGVQHTLLPTLLQKFMLMEFDL